MKVRALQDGELLEVGDRIKVEHTFGLKWETIHRVTEKYGYVRYNERAEGKYRREYQGFGFSPLPRQQWLTTKYSAWRPVK